LVVKVAARCDRVKVAADAGGVGGGGAAQVPDKRFWWVAVRALSTARDWATLEQFAKSKKSPIGFRVRPSAAAAAAATTVRSSIHVPVLTVCCVSFRVPRVSCRVSCRVVCRVSCAACVVL
jgi:hypothetical protein